jgi:hypothetical protein
LEQGSLGSKPAQARDTSSGTLVFVSRRRTTYAAPPSPLPRRIFQVVCSPRIDARLVAALERLDDRDVPIMETYRRLTAVAAGLGLYRPSYERIRQLVHLLRKLGSFPSVGGLLLDVAARSRPPIALGDYLFGGIPPPGPPRSRGSPA